MIKLSWMHFHFFFGTIALAMISECTRRLGIGALPPDDWYWTDWS